MFDEAEYLTHTALTNSEWAEHDHAKSGPTVTQGCEARLVTSMEAPTVRLPSAWLQRSMGLYRTDVPNEGQDCMLGVEKVWRPTSAPVFYSRGMHVLHDAGRLKAPLGGLYHLPRDTLA